MSEEMAVSDNANEDATALSDGAMVETGPETVEPLEQPAEAPLDPPEQAPDVLEDTLEQLPVKTEPEPELEPTEEKPDIDEIQDMEVPLEMDIKDEFEATDNITYPDADKRGIKRRASEAFNEENEADSDVAFKGFEKFEELPQLEYSLILERLEAEVKAAGKGFTPVRTVMATPTAGMRAIKRPRKDTDGSRPSSALSSRSEEDANPSASPAQRGRRVTSDMTSPLFRLPIDMGWKRELVYRAALDAHSRRNADIYYYTPHGKRLRSMREVGENLSGTGLTLDNFSFYKEPLGIDDPEKEIIRDAKLVGGFRRVESPVASPAPSVDAKRTPKPKLPKGATPEPATPKSPPAKLKVKSVGSRLGTPASASKKKPPPAPTPPAPAPAPAPSPAPAPAPATATAAAPQTPDNNNTAAWKKPRALQPALPATPAPRSPAPRSPAPRSPTPRSPTPGSPSSSPPKISKSPPRLVTPPPPSPPPLQSKPVVAASPDLQSPRQLVQPCSMYCGAGVPSLSCSACLCMYHPGCAGFKQTVPPASFLCKNCRKSPSCDPPPLTHKSGVSTSSLPPALALPAPRRMPAPPPNTHKPNDKRVLLRMKVSGCADGERVWAVAQPRAAAPRPPAPLPPPPPPAPPAPSPRLLAIRGGLPQSLAIINGRRFIIVPRPAPLPNAANELTRRTRVPNGAPPLTPPPMAAVSPRRRGRPKAEPKDEVDHFTAFYERAKDTNLPIQIFQYLGMRELAHSARVCRGWRELAATPLLWRHVRMKNSQVNDWGGLCASLKRHGTKWLDLRKMLLPPNDLPFWEQFSLHIGKVDTLERLEMCRCPARAVESASRSLPALRSLSALAIRDGALDPAPLSAAAHLRELRLKSLQGLALTADLTPLAALTHLQHLSLTSIKELGWKACDVVGQLPNLESLELGECTFREEFGSVLARLSRLTRLRLERGTAHCAAPALLRSLATLPALTRLELVNIDVKIGFDDALAECKNIQRLLIIPTYVSQSATTNKQVLSGVLRLRETLTHLMWGVTIELLRVTELFIDQCSAGGGGAAIRELGECIPVLKPVPGCRLPMDHQLVAGPPQVEILPLPTLQRLLSAQLPNTKLKLLRIPFHATWRQSLADFQ